VDSASVIYLEWHFLSDPLTLSQIQGPSDADSTCSKMHIGTLTPLHTYPWALVWNYSREKLFPVARLMQILHGLSFMATGAPLYKPFISLGWPVHWKIVSSHASDMGIACFRLPAHGISITPSMYPNILDSPFSLSGYSLQLPLNGFCVAFMCFQTTLASHHMLPHQFQLTLFMILSWFPGDWTR
jgi:hypothetical protein